MRYFGTNTKMFSTSKQTEEYIIRFAGLIADLNPENVTLFVIPSFTSLERAVKAAEGSNLVIGAQNVGWEAQGQFTGEISVPMLQEIGVTLAMIGHSERRKIFHEADIDVEKKVSFTARNGLTTLLCVGESMEQKRYGITKEILATQLKIGLHSLPSELAKTNLWIAYEPVWSIGVDGVPADKSYVDEMHGYIKEVLCELYGKNTALTIPVLYGGSVNNENARGLMSECNVDGLFIGRSAWDAHNFNKIIRTVL